MLGRAALLGVLTVALAAAQDVPQDAYAAIGSDLVVSKKAVHSLSQLTKWPPAQALEELVRNAVLRQGLTERGVDVDAVDPDELAQVKTSMLGRGIPAEALELLDLEAMVAFSLYARGQVDPAEAEQFYTDFGWRLFGRVRARVIQLETSSVRTHEQAGETLSALAEELGEGVDDATFAQKAAELSEGPFAKLERGDTEWFSARGVSALGSAIPLAIVEACFRKREPGLISAPLRGKVGVYLVRVTAVAPPPPFAELNEVERTYVLDLVASQSPSRRGLTREFLDGVPVRYAPDAPGRGR
ncbi:MAG: peptidyl-prolyl cis-trans isomerase [Planctomycetota bacterium]